MCLVSVGRLLVFRSQVLKGTWPMAILALGRCSKLSSLSSLVCMLDRRGKYEISCSAH